MAKKGISKIKGSPEIELGKTYPYSVSHLYSADDKEKVAKAKWILYVKENGRLRELKPDLKLPPKIGDNTNLKISNQKLAGKELLLEAYIYEPEKSAPPGMKILVKEGKSKIDSVELFYKNGQPIGKSDVLKYGQTIRVKVRTVNMVGRTIKLSLLEDDQPGEGHNEKNRKNIAGKPIPIKIGKTGIVVHDFYLVPNFSAMANAMMDGSSDKLHEYYILVEDGATQKASKNTNVHNPDYVKVQTVTDRGMVTPEIEREHQIEEVVITVKAKRQMGIDKHEVTGNSCQTCDVSQDLKTTNCGEKYCIKKGDKSELIREINIRLAGFGGNVPTDEFTDRTEKMIKQFQKDYMNVPETGKVCGNVLRAIDEFGSKFQVNINEGKCPCKECSGFGKGLFPKEKNNTKILEKSRKYEYPGIHRILLWVEKAIKFYLANQESSRKLRVGLIFSGYRCNANNRQKGRSSTNHMGKALDLHIYGIGNNTNTEKTADAVRDILVKYTKAEYRWGGNNVIALEPSSRNRIGKEFIATTWVHYDVRTFDLEHLKDEYFVKDNNAVNGESIIQIANRLGYQNTCACNKGAANLIKTEKASKSKSKYKWAHTEFGNTIAQFESSDDYNKCNKTEKVAYKVKGKTKYKRIVKVVTNVKVVETTIKEIQQKQTDKELFAVGRYQLIPDTLNAAVSSLSLDVNKNMDQEMQDRIFDDYLIKVKRPKIIAYLEGSGSVEDAMYSSAQEWASIGVEKGKRISDKKNKQGEKIIRYAKGGESYYADDGLNHAHITPEQIKNALINSKNENK